MDEHLVQAAKAAGWSDYQIEMASPDEQHRLAAFYLYAYRAGLEDAAKVCEANQDFDIESHPSRIVFSTANVMARKCATAIRALGENSDAAIDAARKDA